MSRKSQICFDTRKIAMIFTFVFIMNTFSNNIYKNERSSTEIRLQVRIEKNIIPKNIFYTRQKTWKWNASTCKTSETSALICDNYNNCSNHIFIFSGFLGKALIEKLLRCCPDLKTMYLLVRERKGMKPQERVKQILNNGVKILISNPNKNKKSF